MWIRFWFFILALCIAVGGCALAIGSSTITGAYAVVLASASIVLAIFTYLFGVRLSGKCPVEESVEIAGHVVDGVVSHAGDIVGEIIS